MNLWCRLFGHEWIITDHLVAIIGSVLFPPDENHPLVLHRHGFFGKCGWKTVRSRMMHPLAGCNAYCLVCGEQFNDIWPESISMPDIVVQNVCIKMKERRPFWWRRSFNGIL